MAGAIGAVIAFPIILNCGAIVTQSLGAQYVVTGITAAFGATILVSLFRGLFAGSPLHMVAPKTNYAAMVSALLVVVGAMPAFNTAFAATDQRASMLMVVGFMCTALVGITQLILGGSGLGKFVKFVPYPVIAGFINGFTITLLLAQIPLMLGEKSWTQLAGATGNGVFHPGAAALGIAACAITVLAPMLEKRVPPAIWGLVLGTGIYWLLGNIMPAVDWGGVIGAIPSAVPVSPQFESISTLVGSPAFAKLAPELFATALTMALIVSLQSLLSISAVDSVLGTRHDSNRELTLLGAGNFLSGMMGGMPTGGSSSVNRTVLDNGGRGRTTNLTYGLVLLVMMAGLGQMIGLIPVPVMAGVVVATTLNHTDDWSRKLLSCIAGQKRNQWSKELLTNLLLVVTVTFLVVAFGVFPALIAGMILAFSVFVRQSSQSVIRRTIAGAYIRSRTSRSAAARAALNEVAVKVVVVEVQGAIFFGSADQLVQHLENISANLRVIILDLKRTTDIDSTGVVALERIDNALAKASCQLFMAHIGADSPLLRSLREMGFSRVIDQGRTFEDRDSALSAAEDLLLKEAGYPIFTGQERPIHEFDILKGLSHSSLARLSQSMSRIELPAGKFVVREGEAGDAIFFLAAGRVIVTRAIEGRTIRYGNYYSGISFGEIGMLTGRPRSADVQTETAVTLWQLSGEAFRNICQTDPLIAQEILKNISIGLADLVASLSDIVRELEQ